MLHKTGTFKPQQPPMRALSPGCLPSIDHRPTGCATRGCAAEAAERECIERYRGVGNPYAHPTDPCQQACIRDAEGRKEWSMSGPQAMEGKVIHSLRGQCNARMVHSGLAECSPLWPPCGRTPNDGGNAGPEERRGWNLCPSLQRFWQTLLTRAEGRTEGLKRAGSPCC